MTIVLLEVSTHKEREKKKNEEQKKEMKNRKNKEIY
jgi:hypothetical protein